MTHLVLAHSWLWHLIGPFRPVWWPETGQGYAIGSSWAGDVALLAIFGIGWRFLNCHAQGCYRLGLHHVESTPYRACRKHHPTVPRGRVHVSRIHAEHEAARRGRSNPR